MDEMTQWLPSATPMFSDRLLARRSCRVGSPIVDRTVPASQLKKCARQLSFAACNIPPDTAHADDAGVHSMAVSNAVRGVAVRITGTKRDDLQSAIALLKREVTELPLGFDNFRD